MPCNEYGGHIRHRRNLGRLICSRPFSDTIGTLIILLNSKHQTTRTEYCIAKAFLGVRPCECTHTRVYEVPFTYHFALHAVVLCLVIFSIVLHPFVSLETFNGLGMKDEL